MSNLNNIEYRLAILGSVLLLAVSSTVKAQLSTDSFATGAKVEAVAETAKSSIVILSEWMGDAGYEMLLSDAARLSASDLQQHNNVIMVYGDIDSLDASEKTFGVIDQALVQGLPVVLESRHWNVQALHAFTQKYDPDINLEGLQNVAIELTYRDDGTVWAVDTTPGEVAVMAGVPYEKTSEAQAYAQLHTSTLAPIHPAAPFAAGAYSSNPGNIGSYVLSTNSDVYKFWRADSQGKRYCVVAVRSVGDIESWLLRADEDRGGFIELVRPYPAYGGSARIARDFRLRAENIITNIESVTEGCNVYSFTGHSLGAAVMINIAFTLSGSLGNAINEVVGFNSPRMVNSAYRNELRQRLSKAPLHFCRRSDPVWWAPDGLEHYSNGPDGCTYWAPAFTISPSRLFENHRVELWL